MREWIEQVQWVPAALIGLGIIYRYVLRPLRKIHEAFYGRRPKAGDKEPYLGMIEQGKQNAIDIKKVVGQVFPNGGLSLYDMAAKAAVQADTAALKAHSVDENLAALTRQFQAHIKQTESLSSAELLVGLGEIKGSRQ